MPVEVRLPTVLRSQAGGRSVIHAEGSTVGEVLGQLVTAHPGLAGQVVDPDGSLHRFVNVYVNDDDVRYLQQLDTPVKDGDEISILPAVAGGCGPDRIRPLRPGSPGATGEGRPTPPHRRPPRP